MGRDFWILILPIGAVFAGATASVLTATGLPIAAAAIYIGAHATIYCRRLAPYFDGRDLISPFSDGSLWGPPSPLRVAVFGVALILAGGAGLAFEVADWQGVIDLRRY